MINLKKWSLYIGLCQISVLHNIITILINLMKSEPVLRVILYNYIIACLFCSMGVTHTLLD